MPQSFSKLIMYLFISWHTTLKQAWIKQVGIKFIPKSVAHTACDTTSSIMSYENTLPWFSTGPGVNSNVSSHSATRQHKMMHSGATTHRQPDQDATMIHWDITGSLLTLEVYPMWHRTPLNELNTFLWCLIFVLKFQITRLQQSANSLLLNTPCTGSMCCSWNPV